MIKVYQFNPRNLVKVHKFLYAPLLVFKNYLHSFFPQIRIDGIAPQVLSLVFALMTTTELENSLFAIIKKHHSKQKISSNQNQNQRNGLTEQTRQYATLQYDCSTNWLPGDPRLLAMTRYLGISKINSHIVTSALFPSNMNKSISIIRIIPISRQIWVINYCIQNIHFPPPKFQLIASSTTK